MTFTYDAPLLEYMKKKERSVIAVEVMSSQNSDFEVTELYVHLISDKQAAYFKEKKGFRGVQTDVGEVLLPRYRLEYDETIHFQLKKFWIFHSIRQTGIHL